MISNEKKDIYKVIDLNFDHFLSQFVRAIFFFKKWFLKYKNCKHNFRIVNNLNETTVN